MDIWTACRKGNLECVRKYIESDGNVNIQNDNGESLLIEASIRGYADIVRALINAGADVNAYGHKKYSSIIWASYNGHADVVRMLIDAGADVNARDDYGESPIICAAIKGNSPIIWVSYTKRSDILKMLIDAGTDVNARDSDGWSPIMRASCEGYVDSVRMLIEAGTNVNLRNNRGATAFSLALNYGELSIVKYLATLTIPDPGIKYFEYPISLFVPQRKGNHGRKEYIDFVKHLVPIYVNRAVEDSKFGLGMQQDIGEILDGKTSEYRYPLITEDATLLTKLLKTLQSIDYTDRQVVENICIPKNVDGQPVKMLAFGNTDSQEESPAYDMEL